MRMLGLALRRRWLKSKHSESPFEEFLAAPLPESSAAFDDCEFVCLDIETTGLDAKTADLLSVGWVVVRDGRVDLSTCETHLIRPANEVGDSASVHGLTDTQVSHGKDEGLVFSRIIEVLTGRILVVHHAGLDKALLDRLCAARYGPALPLPVVDTLALEHRRQQRRHHVSENQSLRLGDLRERYNLPYYQAHDCLVDAISTAELLIAMVATHDGAEKTRLSQLVTGT
ncbi:MAG: exonuclease domain-containing protein [Woeseiaceae bacterium]|nr:exonuclease domain-containing protein [Woeseiaceae bacterium]